MLIYTCQKLLAMIPSKELFSFIRSFIYLKEILTYLESFQVLHLMNKMNLPPPFGPVTARPPMVTFLIHVLSTVKRIHNLKC